VRADEKEIYAHMDDTLLRKTGKKVDGTKWIRDPLGPPFQTNLVWGQRSIQTSLSLCPKLKVYRPLPYPSTSSIALLLKSPKKTVPRRITGFIRRPKKRQS